MVIPPFPSHSIQVSKNYPGEGGHPQGQRLFVKGKGGAVGPDGHAVVRLGAQPEEDGGDRLGEVGEVLPAAVGELLFHIPVRPHQVGQPALYPLVLGPVVDQRAVVPADVQLGPHTHGVGDVADDFGDALPGQLAYLLLEGAQRPPDMDVLRDDVVPGAALDHAYPDHRVVKGVDAAGDHRLQRRDDIGGRHNGVLDQVGGGGVAACAVQVQVDGVRAGVGWAAAGDQAAHRVAVVGVQAGHKVHRGVVPKDPLPDHILGAPALGAVFLRRLEDQLYIALELLPQLPQDPGCPQKNGGVPVVAAGVGHPVASSISSASMSARMPMVRPGLPPRMTAATPVLK